MKPQISRRTALIAMAALLCLFAIGLWLGRAGAPSASPAVATSNSEDAGGPLERAAKWVEPPRLLGVEYLIDTMSFTPPSPPRNFMLRIEVVSPDGRITFTDAAPD